MTQQEFETLNGWTPSSEAFDYINRVYMAAGEIDKQTFCKDYDQKIHESKIVSYLTSEVELLQGTVKNYEHQVRADHDCLTRFQDSMVDFLVLQAEKLSASDLREKAIDMVGFREYMRRRLIFGFGLWESDRKELEKILSEK